MDELSDLHRVLKVQSMACILQHNDVFITHANQVLVVETSVVEYFALEGVRAIYKKASTRERRVYVGWEPVDILLVFIDRVQFTLEGTVSVKIEEQSSLEDLVADLALDCLDRVFQRHSLETAQGNSLLDHLHT